MVCEVAIELDALFEVLNAFQAADVLQEVEVAEGVDACADQPVPVHALQLDVGVVALELEVQGLREVDVRTLDRVHVFAGGLELTEIKVLREHFH